MKLTEAARIEALKYPNGYVYVVDKAYEKEESVPPEAIIGAWKVDAGGKIFGDFVKNENYKSEKKPGSFLTFNYNRIFNR